MRLALCLLELCGVLVTVVGFGEIDRPSRRVRRPESG